jgi:hypothetical protein
VRRKGEGSAIADQPGQARQLRPAVGIWEGLTYD